RCRREPLQTRCPAFGNAWDYSRRPRAGSHRAPYLRLARESANHRTTRVQNVDRPRPGRISPQVIIDRRAARRILSLRLILLQGRPVVGALYIVDGVGRLEEERIVARHGIAQLS